MTPMFRMLVKELLKPKAKRAPWFNDNPWWARLTDLAVREAHCFEVSAVLDMHRKVYNRMREWEQDQLASGQLAFLPAPFTWIEYARPVLDPDYPGATLGGFIALREFSDASDTAAWIGATAAYNPKAGGWTGWELETIADPLPLRGSFGAKPPNDGFTTAYAILSIINSPAIFDRETHEPHRGIARAAKTAGLGEIRPYHEIKLSLTREAAEATGYGHGEITGERCLHWVRKHPRFRLGRWETVKAHERGSPEKGISLASYRVTP